ncbi:MAG: DUF3604 domain-containing protein [Myxococcota bacterium]
MFQRHPKYAAFALTFFLAACSDAAQNDDDPAACQGAECPTPKCDDFEPLRQPLFGDMHVHTELSFDANSRGTRVGPSAAYAFARGEPIGVQPYDEDGNSLKTIQSERALDFAMVSDHAEFFWTIPLCTDPAEPAYDDALCERYREGGQSAFTAIGILGTAPPETTAYPSLCGEDAADCIDAGVDVWTDNIIPAAEAANDASAACEFTAFIGYEWTANPRTNHLHRDVVFRNAEVPGRAISYFDEPYAEGLWEHLRTDCLDAGEGCDALAIPHNPNMSAGLAFAPEGRDGPFDADYVVERSSMEPLVEIYQSKGQSECKPGELISDELCGFEILPFDNAGSESAGLFVDPNPASFVRSALGEGLKHQENLGANPFKYGIIASTDTHMAAAGSVRERGTPGDINEEADFSGEPREGLVVRPSRSPGGLAGVWAEENSRDSIFDAMRRRETFGTSGPEIVVRFFGGWSYADDICDAAELASIGYAEGVPMGSDLPAQSDDGSAPVFVVSARQDLGTPGDPGMPLQRLQIVKGWIDDAGEHRVQVYDVAGDPDNGAAVDLATCDAQPGAGGFESLCSRWVDPEFDPAERAYYYARVIENPKCRWSQQQCNEAGVDCSNPATVTEGFGECCDLTDAQCEAEAVDCDGDVPSELESCCRPRMPKTIQERAWTSPIWYAPR